MQHPVNDIPEHGVLAYLDHLQSRDFMDAVLARHSVPTLAQAAVRLVYSRERQHVFQSLLFVRDVSIGVFDPVITEAFRAQWPVSGLFDALLTCLQAQDFNLRTQAVYTFGKLCFRENAVHLQRVLAERCDTDPLLLPHLLSELNWLEHDTHAYWQRIQRLAQSTQWLTRWAAVAHIGHNLDAQHPSAEAAVLLQQLVQDSCPYVRQEAVYIQAERQYAINHRPLSRADCKLRKAQLRQERASVVALQPTQRFELLELRYWAANRGLDYTVAELQAFVEAAQDGACMTSGSA